MRQQDRAFRSTERDLERDNRKLERAEKTLETQIKATARKGGAGSDEALRILAKELVGIRKQKTRSRTASSRIAGVRSQSKAMAANVRVGEAMAATSKVWILDPWIRNKKNEF